ncbi:MAG: hypothetical protein ABFC34_16115 [Methanobacterium sp.]
MDNETTGKHENIETFDLDQISLILGDITTIDLHEIFEGADYVLHQAALPRRSKEYEGSFNVQ